MKFLKIVGWIFIPFIMIFFQWKKIGTTGKVLGTVWALFAIVAVLTPKPATHETAVPATSQTVTAPSTNNQDKAAEEAKKKAEEEAKAKADAEAKAKAEEEAKKKAAEAQVNDPGISKAEFEQIQNGMTYEQVSKIIGSGGEMLSEVGSKGDDFYTVVYMWNGESGLGSNANFTFQKNKLQMKAQFGLQ